jgi:hypothetical protein
MKITKAQLRNIIKEELEGMTEEEDISERMSKTDVIKQPAPPAYVITTFAGSGRGGTVPIYITSDKKAAEDVLGQLLGKSVPSFDKSQGDSYKMEVWNGHPSDDSQIRRENPEMFSGEPKPMKKKGIFSEE